MSETEQDTIRTFERVVGLPVVPADLPGLYVVPGYPELTLGQLRSIAWSAWAEHLCQNYRLRSPPTERDE